MTRTRAAIVYAIPGLLGYGRILTAGFAGDDWFFLTIIAFVSSASRGS